jgi:hypothetical protein
VGLERGSGYPGPHDFVRAAADALRFYSRRYGDYPWPTYSVAVMKDVVGLFGTAYPTLGLLGDSSLVLMPHETAHQWFYGLLGNDQSRDPWLSEGLATWAETGPEHSLATMVSTSIPAAVEKRIGRPMTFWSAYDFETFRLGLYVQTVQALAALGSATKVNCALRAFVTGNAYRTTEPKDLVRAFQPFFPDAERVLGRWGARF